MEKNHMRSDSLVEMELTTSSIAQIHQHDYIELMYVVSGRVDVTAGKDRSSLRPKDILVINARSKHSYQAGKDFLLARFLISESKVRKILGQSPVLFWCNSSLDQHEAFSSMRLVINRLLNEELRAGKGGTLYRYYLNYQLLHLLCANFLVPQGDIRYEEEKAESDDRLAAIYSYIRSNYQENIMLQDLAEHLYLSETYVSKYIKKKCGINFVDLVNTIRLEESMEDLLYTDTPVIKLALDNGFASVAAYNKYFKERYKLTPMAYRRKVTEERRKEAESPDARKEQERIREHLGAFLAGEPDTESFRTGVDHELAVCYGQSDSSYENRGGIAVVNAGCLVDLTGASLQDQLKASRKRLGFRYVRFWDPFGSGMNIDIKASRVNYGKMDTALDFLVQNGMKPWFELGEKPIRIHGTVDRVVLDLDYKPLSFGSKEKQEAFWRGFMAHLVKRYTPDEVSSWYFEVHEMEKLDYEKRSFGFSEMRAEEHERYLQSFDMMARIFRSVLPSVRLGGAGFPVQHYGKKGLTDIFLRWEEGHEMPSFITVTSFPYQLEKTDGRYFEKRSSDLDFVLKNIRIAKEAMVAAGLSLQLHVPEFGLTLSDRNVVNDGCHNGAFLLRTLIAASAEDDVMLGHWLFSDLYSDQGDTDEVLFGGTGLLNKHGIPKPAWYAYDFMNTMGRDVLLRTSCCMVTKGTDGSLRIIAHNLKPLTFSYYATNEDKVKVEELEHMYEDTEALRLRLTVRDIPDGSYLLKRRQVNGFYGNIQHNWRDMGLEPVLTDLEVKHLHKVSTSHLTIQRMDAKNRALQLTLELKANEMTCLIILPGE